jgi:hypothetical protein
MGCATLIMFSPSVRKFARFDGDSLSESSRKLFAARDRLTVRDYQEVIIGRTWHRIALDIDLSQEHGSIETRRMSVSDFRSGLETIIECATDVMIAMFGEVVTRDDFIVCESLDEREPDRFGAHITIARMVPNNKVVARFTDALISALPNELRALIDRSINSAQHNLRLIGCAKPGSIRVKRFAKPSSTTASPLLEVDALVCAPARHIATEFADEEGEGEGEGEGGDGRRARNDKQLIAMSPVNDKKVAHACELIDAKYGHGVHVFRSACGGSVVTFRRCAPSRCNICARTHDHDNTVVVCIDESDIGTTYREICRHAPSDSSSPGTAGHGTSSSEHALVLDEVPRSDDVDEAINDADEPIAAASRQPSASSSGRVAPMSEHCARKEIYSEPTMRPYPDARTVFVRAPMKLGKTKMLRKYVTEHAGDDETHIVILSFRRTFTRSIASVFSEFALYTDVTGPLIFSKMIVQVESLHRIEPDKLGDIDILIMDESESIISQFDSGLSKNRAMDFAVFSWLVKRAKMCIALDAYMSDRTYALIGRMRGWSDSVLVRNEYKNARDQSWYFTSARDLWLITILYCVGKGERFVICANSAIEGQTLREMIKDKYASAHHRDTPRPNVGQHNGVVPRIKFYSAETPTSVKSRDFGEVDQYWTDCDILIYTPTLTAGVSFEREHFDELFGYFTDRSCDAQTCIQMMGRVRNIARHRAFICVKGSRGMLPTTREDILLSLRIRKGAIFDDAPDVEFDDRGLPSIPDTDYSELRVRNIVARNKSRNWFAREMIGMVAETGAKIARLDMATTCAIIGRTISDDEITDAHGTHVSCMGDIMVGNARDIAGARDLVPEEYEQIRSQLSASGVDAPDADRHAAQKFVLRTVYDVRAQRVDEGFVMCYNYPDVARAFGNLREIYGAMKKAIGAPGAPGIESISPELVLASLRIVRTTDRTRMCVAHEGDTIDELDVAHTYELHRLAHVMLTGIGFACGIFDHGTIARRRAEDCADAFARRAGPHFWHSLASCFKLKKERIALGASSSDERDRKITGEMVIGWTRQVLVDAYLMNLVLIDGKMYELARSSAFEVIGLDVRVSNK